MNDLIEKLVRFIQGQSRFKRATFELDLTDDLPIMNADPGQIQQVLLNLYANAADASGDCTIQTLSRTQTDGQRIAVTVRDNGPGMPPDVVDRIFDSGFTTKDEGHGHGLAICRRIVENHGGTIGVESEPGVGTTFTLSFKV